LLLFEDTPPLSTCAAALNSRRSSQFTPQLLTHAAALNSRRSAAYRSGLSSSMKTWRGRSRRSTQTTRLAPRRTNRSPARSTVMHRVTHLGHDDQAQRPSNAAPELPNHIQPATQPATAITAAKMRRKRPILNLTDSFGVISAGVVLADKGNDGVHRLIVGFRATLEPIVDIQVFKLEKPRVTALRFFGEPVVAVTGKWHQQQLELE
jgi:hypothetical protein